MQQQCVSCKNSSNAILCQQCGQALDSCFDKSAEFNAFVYREPVKTLIHKFKYQQDLLAAKILAQSAAIIFSGMWQQFDAIIPMPANPKRIASRGIHCTDYLARLIMHYCLKPLPIIDTYTWRPVLSVSQQELSYEERLKNINSDHFCVPDLRLKRYLVFEDVVTTGATWRAFQNLAPEKFFLMSLARTS